MLIRKKHQLNRRMMLRGLLGGAAVAIGLPALEIFLNSNGTALAGGDPLPRRFGIFFWGNGILPDRWVPAGNGPSWELSPTLVPLADVKEHVTIVTGMKVYTGNSFPHLSGPAGIFAGAPYVNGDSSTFSVPSIDQVIAQEIGGDTRFRSLEIGVQPDGYSLSFNGPHSNNPPETSPKAFFNRVFGGDFVLPGTTAAPNPRLALRRSVLDAVAGDAKRLQQKLGAADKARLDQHLEGIGELESQLLKLEKNPPSLAACSVPPPPKDAYPPVDGRHPLSEISRAMVDILVMALACDQTRVFSDWFSSPVDNLLYPDATAGHHQLTHDEPGDQLQVHDILLYIMAEYAYLVSSLANVAEGDSTLLDHCAVLGTTDCSYGRAHSVEEYPILIAGSANGNLQKGVHYRSASNENTSKLLLTLSRAMGLTLDSYGVAEGKVNSSLTAIEV